MRPSGLFLVLHAGDRLVAEVQQRDVEDAVGHVDAALGIAGTRHAERFLEELGGLFRIAHRYGDVAKLVGHGELL